MARSVGSATRMARIMAHRFFDPLWEEGHMTRHEAYAWLAKEAELPIHECHIGMFDKEMCEAVAYVCWEKLKECRQRETCQVAE